MVQDLAINKLSQSTLIMKAIKLISHPIIVICTFLFVLISGESFGGFYFTYILLGLHYGALHSFFAIFAIVSICSGFTISIKSKSWLKNILYIIGLLFMVFALLIFFGNSKGYNDSTFHQILPLISLVLFSLSGICNFYTSIIELLKTIPPKKKA